MRKTTTEEKPKKVDKKPRRSRVKPTIRVEYAVIWHEVTEQGSNQSLVIRRRVAEQCFDPSTGWASHIEESHGYRIRQLRDGRMVYRPATFQGDDEIRG